MTNYLFSVFQDERFMDLTVYQYGYEQCEPLHSFGPYVRNNYLFHYVISGKGCLHANDEKGDVKEILASIVSFLVFFLASFGI